MTYEEIIEAIEVKTRMQRQEVAALLGLHAGTLSRRMPGSKTQREPNSEAVTAAELAYAFLKMDRATLRRQILEGAAYQFSPSVRALAERVIEHKTQR